MTRRWIAIAAALMIIAAACGDAEDTGEPGRFDVAAIDTVPRGRSAVLTGSLWAGPGSDPDGIVTRLCAGLAESFPPACGSPSVRLTGITAGDFLGVAPAVQGVQWLDHVTVSGVYDGDLFAVQSIEQTVSTVEDLGLRIRLGYRPPLVAGDAVAWLLDVTNTAGEPVTLVFGSGQRGEAVLMAGDREVYRWSTDRAFTEAIEEVTLQPGEMIAITLDDTLRVDPGRYALRGWVTASVDGTRLGELTMTVEVGGSPLPTTTSTTTTTLPGLREGAAEDALAWIAALAAGDLDLAASLMSPASLEYVENRGGLAAFATELAEGWGAWDGVADRRVWALEARFGDGTAGTTVVLLGTIEQEGMTERRVATLVMTAGGGRFLADPFSQAVDIGFVVPRADFLDRVAPDVAFEIATPPGFEVVLYLEDGVQLQAEVTDRGDRVVVTALADPLPQPGEHVLTVLFRTADGDVGARSVLFATYP